MRRDIQATCTVSALARPDPADDRARDLPGLGIDNGGGIREQGIEFRLRFFPSGEKGRSSAASPVLQVL